MSNGTKKISPDTLRDRLVQVIESYRGLLRADERRLHEAMLDFERSCWQKCTQRAA